MAILLDSRLDEVRDLLRSLQRCVDDLVSDALILLRDPLCGLGRDAESRDQKVNQLERGLQEVIAEIFARYQPVATAHRFLLAVMAAATELEHMGDSSKDICGIAWEIGTPSTSFVRLLHLTQRRAAECSRILHQLEFPKRVERGVESREQIDTRLAGQVSACRVEAEDAFENVLTDLEKVASLTRRQLERQLLVAMDLKRICEYAAGIADELIFFQSGTRRVPAPERDEDSRG